MSPRRIRTSRASRRSWRRAIGVVDRGAVVNNGAVSALDLPPGIGLAGTPLGTFHAPRRARRAALIAVIAIVVFGAITWLLVSRHP